MGSNYHRLKNITVLNINITTQVSKTTRNPYKYNFELTCQCVKELFQISTNGIKKENLRYFVKTFVSTCQSVE